MTNCCNDYGECTQGDNCPIRCTRCEPETPTASSFEQIAFWLPLVASGLVSVIVTACLLCYGLFASGWVDFLLPTK